MSDTTGAKQDTKFKPGQSGNPKGRPKGSRNKFAETFLKDFLKEWEAHGATVLKEAREKDPSSFLRVAASILPKEFNVNEGETALERLLEQYSDESLDQLITGLCALGDVKQSARDQEEARAGEPTRTIQ